MADDEITQDKRLLKVYTPLDYDTLLIDSFSGVDGISQPFHFSVKLVADVLTNKHLAVTPDKLLGKAMAIEVELTGEKKRFFNGVVRSFVKEAQDGRFAHYRAEMVPWFSLASLKADCKIFQNATVPDIIEEVVEKLGYSKYFRSDLTRTYTAWDYCVQYRETDFNFLSRLMEEEGIAYYFEHNDDMTHVLVLVDTPDGFTPCPKESSFRFEPEIGIGEFADTVRSWEIHGELLSSKWSFRDYHHELPDNMLECPETSMFASDVNKPLEMFDFPGDYAKKFNQPEARLGKVRPEGEKVARIRMQRDERNHVTYQGMSHCRAFTAGYKFTISGTSHVESGSYLLTSIQHQGVQHPHYLADASIGGTAYTNMFACLPSKVGFVPARTTPKPVIHGLQTARVIDEHPTPTEEIWPDQYGRVLVRFHWDREAKYACWVRVSHPWAGNQWGQQWIPRVGDEVVIAFLEGDPDCPLIVGSVYNADNLPPFSLPENKTQSGVLTHSPKGSSQHFNMLRFEDKKGEEEIYLHAQRKLKTTVEQNEVRYVGANRTTTIHKNDTETVEKGDHTLTVSEGDRSATISQGDDSLTVTLGNVTHQAPQGTYKVEAMNVEVTGTMGIKLTCGGSTIEMTPAMITINSPIVKIN